MIGTFCAPCTVTGFSCLKFSLFSINELFNTSLPELSVRVYMASSNIIFVSENNSYLMMKLIMPSCGTHPNKNYYSSSAYFQKEFGTSFISGFT